MSCYLVKLELNDEDRTAVDPGRMEVANEESILDSMGKR